MSDIAGHQSLPDLVSAGERRAYAPQLGALAAAVTWALASGSVFLRDDIGDWGRSREYGLVIAAASLLLAGAALAAPFHEAASRKLRYWSPWLAVLGLALAAWELVTAKFAVLPQPFFPPPQALLEVFTDDFAKLGESTVASIKLHATGYLIGAAVGFLTGVSIGWSRIAGYWVHPILRFVGPLPATAWLPLAFFAFPSSWSASTFLIALAAAFPVTILTWSGVAAVPTAYYDVARTLGASRTFLVTKVAVPAALPHVFVGLFMGLGSSFAVLVVAELLGVKAGLGWYLQWAQGWASYANMYAALIVLSLLCSTLITMLFRLRDRTLGWQKGLVKW